ncbi:hypothetical protein EV643_114222 [Kribbella sp. VKM Ac-2527]|uniref:Uncharacterized protein n=1 Tax=Kribbella caucasensis TaxID=2512215 RepID=A0A4R6K9C4_9ACTN|nr:hypothetical protein [Kribbella sp. VKM Ac-2527]TDO45077.1 hypothetical protein EV643_114222 [Kribbella sp. VKM Ac-2527]
MKTLDRPLDDDDRAMADLADVRDWRRLGGPHAGETGPVPVRKLIKRVGSATGWKPWPVNRKTVIDDQLDGWGFLTRRRTEMAVYDDQILPHSPFSGWVAFAIAPDDVAAAEAGLDEHWPVKFELARRHWGQPTYVGSDNQPGFVDEWAPGAGTSRRHLAVWSPPGAQIHLYSVKPMKDPLSVSVGINYAVYLDEEGS